MTKDKILIGHDKQGNPVFVERIPFIIMARARGGMTKPLKNLMAQMQKDGQNMIVVSDPKDEMI